MPEFMGQMGHLSHAAEGDGWTWPIVGHRPVRLLGVIPWGERTVREFRLSNETPLTYVDCDGGRWRPNQRFESDCASIPFLVRWLPDYQVDRYVWPFFHDSAYRLHSNGKHGLWYARPDLGVFTFREMTRQQVDRLCAYDMAIAEGARVTQAAAMLAAVRVGGVLAWQ